MKYLHHITLLLITATGMAIGFFTAPRPIPHTQGAPSAPAGITTKTDNVAERSASERLAEILQQPRGTTPDKILENLSDELAPSDPESAVRALMLCQTRNPLGDLLERLSNEDPSALQRLLSEAKELRFRNYLEAYLLKVQFSGNPQGLLRKAETVQNKMRTRLTLWAVESLSKENPSLALEEARNLAPGTARMSILKLAMEPAMEEDPQGTLRWLAQNAGEHTTFQVVDAMIEYHAKHPERTKELIINAPAEIQRDLVEGAMVRLILSDTSEALLQFLNGFPPHIQSHVIRTIPGDVLEKAILPKLPTETRQAAIEKITWNHDNEDLPTWIDTLQTQEDKDAAVRVIPHLPFMEEEQKTALLQKLKR